MNRGPKSPVNQQNSFNQQASAEDFQRYQQYEERDDYAYSQHYHEDMRSEDFQEHYEYDAAGYQRLQTPAPNSARDTFIQAPEVEEAVTLPRKLPIVEQQPVYQEPMYRQAPPAPPTRLEPVFTQPSPTPLAAATPLRPDPAKSIKQRRCMYGCIPTNSRSRIICLSIVFLFMTVFGVLLFLFYPRYQLLTQNS
jgi:hypothetical protein